MNQRKRFNTISETKSNTVHWKCINLLSLQQQSQDLYAVIPELPFHCFVLANLLISKFAILFKFFSKKTNHFLSKPSTFFLSSVTFILPLTFSCLSKSLHYFFFLLLELSFFRFRCQTVFCEHLLRFCVHFLQISLLGLQEVATFDFSSCF